MNIRRSRRRLTTILSLLSFIAGLMLISQFWMSSQNSYGKKEKSDASTVPMVPQNNHDAFQNGHKFQNSDRSQLFTTVNHSTVASTAGVLDLSSTNSSLRKPKDEISAQIPAKVEEEVLNYRSSTPVEVKILEEVTLPILSEIETETNLVDKDDFAVGMDDFAADRNIFVFVPPPTKPVLKTDSGNSWTSVENSVNGSLGNRNQRSVKVVSMSLYGADHRYTMGAIRNAEIIRKNFPGWSLRIYAESPSSAAPRFGFVPTDVIERLRSLGVDIQYVMHELEFIPPMMWRFLVADDLSVDSFVVRDSDSRLTQRDFAAISTWLRSGKPFHSIRDHPSHAGYAISGGLWGGRTRELRDILRRSWVDLMRGTSSEYLKDMDFLNSVIWPKVEIHSYCSDSVSCDRWPNSFPFPVQRHGYEHVGQVFNEHDLGRPGDIQILKMTGENPRCVG